jgi:hypothetical protein
MPLVIGKNRSTLQPGIYLLIFRGRYVFLPGITRRLDLVKVHSGRDLALELEKLHAEALGDMPRDVTVHDPRAGVVDLS